MSRRARASSHATGKTPAKAPCKASRSRRELASPDDISNTMSLLACTDATHTASCRSAGLSRDPRAKDSAAAAQRAQLPVIEDSTSMSPYYGVPPPEPVRPDNSHTGALPDHPESLSSSQGQELAQEAPVAAEPTRPSKGLQPTAAAAAPPPPPPPCQDPHPPPRQEPPSEAATPQELPPPQHPPSWRPEPPIPAPARLHHPSRAPAPRAEAPPQADFLNAPPPVDKVLLHRFLANAADTQGVPEDARAASSSSSTGSAAPPAATLTRAAPPGKPAPRGAAAMAAMYLTPRRGSRAPGEHASAHPTGGRQQHAQSAISALYRFATLAAERRAGGNASAPVVPPLSPHRRSAGLPRHSLSGELKPLLQEDSQLTPVPQASVATGTPREDPSPRRTRSASRNRRTWGCGPRASLACICGMPEVDEGSAFDLVPLVPTDAELSTRGEPRQAIRPQRQEATPPLQGGRHQHPAYAMYQGAPSRPHLQRSPLSGPSSSTLTPRQQLQARRGPPRSALHSSPHASGAEHQKRNSPRAHPTGEPARMASPHWRDAKRQELSGALAQRSPLRHSEDGTRGSGRCRRCGTPACRCAHRGAPPHSMHTGECTPRTGYGSPRLPQGGYASQQLRSPRPESNYTGSALQRADSQPMVHSLPRSSHRSAPPQRMLGALGEYRGTRAAPVRPGPNGGPAEGRPERFRTMQETMAAQVPPTAAVAAQRVQGAFRQTPQRLEATCSWTPSAAITSEGITGAAAEPTTDCDAGAVAAAEEDAAGDAHADAVSEPPEAPAAQDTGGEDDAADDGFDDGVVEGARADVEPAAEPAVESDVASEAEQGGASCMSVQQEALEGGYGGDQPTSQQLVAA